MPQPKQQEWEVEQIVGRRKHRSVLEYEVVWRGHPGCNTWEAIANLSGAKASILKFEKRHAVTDGRPKLLFENIHFLLTGWLVTP
jgi:hypothetical protein